MIPTSAASLRALLLGDASVSPEAGAWFAPPTPSIVVHLTASTCVSPPGRGPQGASHRVVADATSAARPLPMALRPPSDVWTGVEPAVSPGSRGRSAASCAASRPTPIEAAGASPSWASHIRSRSMRVRVGTDSAFRASQVAPPVETVVSQVAGRSNGQKSSPAVKTSVSSGRTSSGCITSYPSSVKTRRAVKPRLPVEMRSLREPASSSSSIVSGRSRTCRLPAVPLSCALCQQMRTRCCPLTVRLRRGSAEGGRWGATLDGSQRARRRCLSRQATVAAPPRAPHARRARRRRVGRCRHEEPKTRCLLTDRTARHRRCMAGAAGGRRRRVAGR
eukprot:scaffold222333_cov30-Tisochrysis_lutea.AAC.1